MDQANKDKKDKDASLVIDLKRLAKEKAETSAVVIKTEEGSKNNNSRSRRKKRGFVLFKKKKKDINFIDKEAFPDMDVYGKDPVEETELDPESAESIEKAFMTEEEREAAEKKQGFKPFMPARRLFWLFVFIPRFIYFLFVRIAGVISKRLRESARPRFGKKNESFWMRFFRYLIHLPGNSISGLAEMFTGRKEEERLFQESLLFERAPNRRMSPAKQALSFACLALVLALPLKAFSYYQSIKAGDFKGRVMGAAEEAVNSLRSAGDSITEKEMSKASSAFVKASDNFKKARQEVEEIDDIFLKLAKFSPKKEDKMAAFSKEILEAGELASGIGADLSSAFNSFSMISDGDIMGSVKGFLKHEEKALKKALRMRETLGRINSKALPKEYRDTFSLLRQKSDELASVLSEISDLTEKAGIFLGFEKDKRYLVLFQNNNEMRATGGFIGSFALVDFSKGRLEDIRIPGGGSYDTEGGLFSRIVAPEPLHLVDPMWHFWDANWWPDWKKSAQKLAWFYEKSGGPTVDGCIALTPEVLEKILRITGPIDMSKEHGLIMNADNFRINLRDAIEKEKLEDQKLPNEVAENKPKKIIGEFFSRLMDELPRDMDKESLALLLGALEESLQEKHILFYFKNNELQKEAENRGWAGRIKDTNKDYLMVVNTNIAGGKSDRRIKQEIEHKAEIMPDGRIVDTLRINREHTGRDGEPYYGVRNVNWMRIYVPKGAKLLEAAGFRGPDPIYFEEPEDDWSLDPDVATEEAEMVIDKENQNTYVYTDSGKTVFANWSMVDPGENREIYIKYELPFKLEKKEEEIKEKSRLAEMFNRIMKVEKKALYPYSLMIQKQAGAKTSLVHSEFLISDIFSPVWKYPQTVEVDESGWDSKNSLDEDIYRAVIMERENKEE